MSEAQRWESEYRDGRWQFLRELREAARLGVVAAYLHHLDAVGRVLDIGCGEGHLRHHLDRARLRRYVGVDVAQAALDLAAADPIEDRPGRSLFVHAGMEAYAPEPGEAFDGILFNEVLFFTSEPGRQVERARPWLAPGGVIVVSLYEKQGADGKPRASALAPWAAIDALGWTTLDESRITNRGKGITWTIRALRPT